MRLYLIRHARPQVASDVCYGSTDVAVTAQEQARVLRSLLPLLPNGVRLFSSPLQRCAELARCMVNALGGVALTFDARLAEMHFGTWELRRWNDIPRAEIDAWANDVVGYRPGGGESVASMAQRVRAVYDDLLLMQDDCIVVCHAGTIRLLLAAQRGGSPLEMAQYVAQTRHNVAYGDVVILDC